MIGIRTRLVVTLAAAGLALSGCTSTGTNTSGSVSPKNATTTSPQKAAPAPLASKGLPSKAAPAPPASKEITPMSAPGNAKDASGDIEDASADVKLGAIRVDAKLGSPSAEITITNHSTKRSNYIVDLSITSADGKTQLDAAMVSVQGVSPGHTTKQAAQFTTTKKLPTGAKLTVVGVARLVA